MDIISNVSSSAASSRVASFLQRRERLRFMFALISFLLSASARLPPPVIFKSVTRRSFSLRTLRTLPLLASLSTSAVMLGLDRWSRLPISDIGSGPFQRISRTQYSGSCGVSLDCGLFAFMVKMARTMRIMFAAVRSSVIVCEPSADAFAGTNSSYYELIIIGCVAHCAGGPRAPDF